MPAIFNKLDKLKIIYDIAYKILNVVCKILLIGDILVTIYMVIGRYITFIAPPVWGEQIVLTLMVYMTVLSAALALRRGAHIRMTSFDKYLNKNVVRSLDLLADIGVMAFGVILLIYGLQVCNSPLAKFGKYDSIPTLSRVWMYLPMPLAGIFTILFELEQVYTHIKAFFVKEKTDENNSIGEVSKA
ncbi:MAG: TRAP transporter small permease [Clostridia bacterium]|nr:TRAP transporter small permease [Clostridia bacterium]